MLSTMEHWPCKPFIPFVFTCYLVGVVMQIQKMPMDAGWSEDAVTPISVKKSTEATSMQLEESRATGIEECGQPSPVSVLESPFLDEVPTTPEASLAG